MPHQETVILDENYFTFFFTGGLVNDNPDSSLGGTFSRERIGTHNATASLFDDVTYAERAAGSTEYRGVSLQNRITTGPEDYTFYNVKVWIYGSLSDGEIISITTASSGLMTHHDDAQWTMSEIPNETTTPGDSVTWYTSSQTISVGDLPTWSAYGFWIKRYVPPGTPATKSSTLRIKVYADAIAGATIV